MGWKKNTLHVAYTLKQNKRETDRMNVHVRMSE